MERTVEDQLGRQSPIVLKHVGGKNKKSASVYSTTKKGWAQSEA